MLSYPQLFSGAVAQFPMTRMYAVSNVSNLQEDGSRYRAAGVDPARLNWNLSYQNISESEADVLAKFFQTTNGRLLSFTFLDPLGNLLAWSEDLGKPVWETTPLTTIISVESDIGTVSQLNGSVAGAGKLSQLIPCPASALVCFSCFAKAEAATQALLAITDAGGRTERAFPVGRSWQPLFISQAGTGDSVGKTVELAFPTGSQLEVARLNVSPQPAPGNYIKTQSNSGVFQQTRFDQDSLRIIASGPGAFGCSVQLTSRLG